MYRPQIYFNPNTKIKGFPANEYIFAHELGHNIDELLSSRTAKDYSETYPIFRKNTLLQKLKTSAHPNDRPLVTSNPNILGHIGEYHDAVPSESYADLISLRDLLYRSGIYDSRKANNLFTKHHLEQFKKINPKFRLFNYFSDEDIITMMNEVAQNNTTSSNLNLYAKQGIKLISRTRFN